MPTGLTYHFSVVEAFKCPRKNVCVADHFNISARTVSMLLNDEIVGQSFRFPLFQLKTSADFCFATIELLHRFTHVSCGHRAEKMHSISTNVNTPISFAAISPTVSVNVAAQES